MKRLAVVGAFLATLGAAGGTPVAAAASPTLAPVASPTPNDLRLRLSGSLADAVAAQAQVARALQQNAAERESVRRQLAATEARIAQLDASVAAREVEIGDLSARIAGERAGVAELARAIDEQPASVLRRLAGARRLGDLLSGVMELAAAGRRGEALAAALERDRERLEQEQEAERAERESQDGMRASQQADLDRLRQLMAEEDRVSGALAASIMRTRAELARAIPADAALVDQLQRQLLADQALLIAAAQQVAWDQATVWMDDNPDAMAALGPARPPALSWPVPGAGVTQPFGPTDLTIEPPYGGYPHFHTGIDLAAPPGTPVQAADDGMVAAVATDTTGYGTYVVVGTAGGLTTLYGHLMEPLVAVGERVARGQPIGLVGSTGSSTGPHCHFEVRLAGRPVDPLPLVRG